MTERIQWQHGVKADGRPYYCFETFDVTVDGRTVGMFQCVGGPGESGCRGIMAERNHRHGPWIGFVGPDSEKARNLAGRFDSQRGAAEAVAAAAAST